MKKTLSILLLLTCISFGASAQAQTKCKEITQKGTQCTRVAKIDGYCTQHYKMHNPPKGEKRCKAITKKGTQCTREAKKEGFCTQHYNIEKKKQQSK